MQNTDVKNSTGIQPLFNQGALWAFLAFFSWGIVPIYWKNLKHVGFQEVLSHRIFWAALSMSFYVLYRGELKNFFSLFKEKKTFWALVVSSMLIMFNWNLYIWAVSTGHIVEGSLGYFLNPLLNVLIGVFFLKETLKTSHWVAFSFAFVAIVILFSQNAGKPWISVGLALSFAFYGLLRKKFPVPAHLGQMFETILLLPIVLIHFSYLAYRHEFVFYKQIF